MSHDWPVSVFSLILGFNYGYWYFKQSAKSHASNSIVLSCVWMEEERCTMVETAKLLAKLKSRVGS